MTTLTEFLLARIVEDEAVACGATAGQWVRRPQGGSVVRADSEMQDEYVFQTSGLNWSRNAGFIAHNNPTRVLAECEAKRQIVQELETVHADYRAAPSLTSEAQRFGLRKAVAFLALPYADHPDYDETWRP